jgi:5-methylcytosine-specific restriction endonuclease McrA
VSSNYRNHSTKKSKARKPPASSAPVPAPKSIREKTSGYEREQRHPSGPVWKRKVANVVQAYNGICHLCDHPGALQGDHVIQYAEDGTDDISNIRPAHGTAGKQKNRCPVCNLNCNNIRGALSVEAGRRKIARRIKGMTFSEEADEPFDW